MSVVTLQAQKEYPPDMQCKDKFLLESTIVNNDADELPPDTSQAVQRARDERDAVFRQTQQLQQELEVLKRRKNRRSDAGFSLKFALLVGLIGLVVGFLLKLLMSSPSTE
ncbi:hypothetical protein K7X08_029196 [Anisodus acutangulus]|uniref:Uncharacterized protein n=1 Tax=Anisodus acutangulus TaxID=402998 RepID=A0A9Q1L292_9SOLA|nr:hypothetical protein K7X08_029196 [Anisodus acutangulus]